MPRTAIATFKPNDPSALTFLDRRLEILDHVGRVVGELDGSSNGRWD
jgi:hypothetical protein